MVEGGLLAGERRGRSTFVLMMEEGLLVPKSLRTCSGDIGRFLLFVDEGVLVALKFGFEPK